MCATRRKPRWQPPSGPSREVGRCPFETTPAGDPLQAGRQRLKGAFLIDVARIRPDPKQPRREFDDGELKELTTSVSERGLKQPLRVWFVANDDIYQIVSGERRYRAALAAGGKKPPYDLEISSIWHHQIVILTLW